MAHELTQEQAQVLKDFARYYGRNWKGHLHSLWASGRDERHKDGAILRQIRNEFGPEWLIKYKEG